VDQGRIEIITSALTLLEVLDVPYRRGDHVLAGRYESILTRSRDVRIADISGDHLRAAAQLRAGTRVKVPDAVQLVAAFDNQPAILRGEHGTSSSTKIRTR
jgi:hypothetical protein